MRFPRDLPSSLVARSLSGPCRKRSRARGNVPALRTGRTGRPAGGALVVVAIAYAVGCSRTPSETVAPPDAGPTLSAQPRLATDSGASSAAIPSASVEAFVNPERLPAYDGPTGSVEGTVLVKGPDAPDLPGMDFRVCPAALDTYGKLFRAGPARADGLRPLADAVIVITGYSGFYLPEKDSAERVTINVNCGYPTRTIAMTFGQTLEIANDSAVPFGPRLSGIYQPAVMIAPPQQRGEPVKLNPPRPGHYVLGDEMQTFVRQAVVVLLQPLHAVSNLQGHYRIDGVPVGALKVGAQLDALGNRMQPSDVLVRPNVVENVDLVLTYAPSDGGRPVVPKVVP